MVGLSASVILEIWENLFSRAVQLGVTKKVGAVVSVVVFQVMLRVAWVW
jgi:hypothetical protein